MQRSIVQGINFFIQDFTWAECISHCIYIIGRVNAIANIGQKLFLLCIQYLVDGRIFCIGIIIKSDTQQKFICKFHFVTYINL